VLRWESEAMANPGDVLRAEVVEEDVQLTLVQLCHACDAEPQALAELVAHGVLDPRGDDAGDWLFTGESLGRSRLALRLIRGLGLNVAGAALAMELMDRIDRLQKLLDAKETEE
jgi:chaperone modulatory protein CbpM